MLSTRKGLCWCIAIIGEVKIFCIPYPNTPVSLQFLTRTLIVCKDVIFNVITKLHNTPVLMKLSIKLTTQDPRIKRNERVETDSPKHTIYMTLKTVNFLVHMARNTTLQTPLFKHTVRLVNVINFSKIHKNTTKNKLVP